MVSSAPGAAFRARNLGHRIDGRDILADVALDFPAGQVTAVVGHNGSGKSVLLRMLARQLLPQSGEILFEGEPLAALPPRAFARAVAYLPQEPATGNAMTVAELVAAGRYPWHGALGRFGADDSEAVEAALALTQLTPLRERFLETLSGGERQRAWIAMLVAQNSRALLLDEPTSALDLPHQLEVLGLVRRLSREKGLSVIVVLHDINMAARFCDHIHALKGGRVVASGTPAEILQPAQLSKIYGIEMQTLPCPGSPLPLAYAL